LGKESCGNIPAEWVIIGKRCIAVLEVVTLKAPIGIRRAIVAAVRENLIFNKARVLRIR
jgi:predicted transcriptional regulator